MKGELILMTINELIAKGNYKAAADVLYSSLLFLINNYVPDVAISREEFALVAPDFVKKLQDPTIKPSEPTPDPGDDIVISKPTGTLEITFEGPEGDEEFVAPDKVTKEIRVGGTYTYNAPTVDGYTANPEVITGKMVKAGVKTTVTYTAEEEPVEPTKYTLTVDYEGPEGDSEFVAPRSYVAELEEGEEYSVDAPAIEGYEPNTDKLTGTMPAEDLSLKITYIKSEVGTPSTLTITYVGPEGDEEFVEPDPYMEEYEPGTEYSVESPVVEGYTPDQAVVEGTIGAEDVDVVVSYTKNPTE